MPVLPALVSAPSLTKTPPLPLAKLTLVPSSVKAKLAPGWLSSVPPLSMNRVVAKPPPEMLRTIWPVPGLFSVRVS